MQLPATSPLAVEQKALLLAKLAGPASNSTHFMAALLTSGLLAELLRLPPDLGAAMSQLAGPEALDAVQVGRVLLAAVHSGWHS